MEQREIKPPDQMESVDAYLDQYPQSFWDWLEGDDDLEPNERDD